LPMPITRRILICPGVPRLTGDRSMTEKEKKDGMTVKEAGHKGGEKGGQKVRELIEKSREAEEK
jgi:hypothetical protein